MRISVLDHGYVELVESWGSDERIIEAARMSTGKGFEGWEKCPDCGTILTQVQPHTKAPGIFCENEHPQLVPHDAKLLAFLYKNHHATPFEMAGLVIEVKAPIFVFREWHRHRTLVPFEDELGAVSSLSASEPVQSFNEMSARYIPLPDENYLPSYERVVKGAQSGSNKQAAGTQPLLREAISDWQQAVSAAYEALERTYQTGLSLGIPKELARIVLPVGRYSRMRASANLRNWLAFLTLRLAPNAQWEIRQYADAVATLIAEKFPRTYELFKGEPDGKEG